MPIVIWRSNENQVDPWRPAFAGVDNRGFPRIGQPKEVCAMSALLIGYARVSTDQQDLTSQRDGLAALGVAANRIYVDHGLTGTNRERPGLREALAACREGDTLVVTKLDRLARSLPDARAIADELTVRQVSLNLGGSVYNPNDPVGRLLFNVLAMVAEFESDLIRLRTREGMKVAKAKGHLRGKQPKLNHRQEAHLVSLLETGEYTTADLADLFGVARSTVYRAVERERILKAATASTPAPEI
jgi:DNA invertase Pin-like site-specific DNA recombinase